MRNKNLFILTRNSRLRIQSRDIIYKMALEGTVIFKSPMADSFRPPKVREKQHSTISLEIIIQWEIHKESATAQINGTSDHIALKGQLMKMVKRGRGNSISCQMVTS